MTLKDAEAAARDAWAAHVKTATGFERAQPFAQNAVVEYDVLTASGFDADEARELVLTRLRDHIRASAEEWRDQILVAERRAAAVKIW